MTLELQPYNGFEEQQAMVIQDVLYYLTSATIAGLIVYQTSQVTAEVRRVSSERSGQSWGHFAGGISLLYQIFHAIYFPSLMHGKATYFDGLPNLLTSFYGPSIVAVVLLGLSSTFRNYVESMSLPVLVVTVAAWCRMIVGVFFLFWYFAGRLPALFAFIAGPGDWISGFLAIVAMRKLQALPLAVGLHSPGDSPLKVWSTESFLEKFRKATLTRSQLESLQQAVRVATAYVLVGVADFLAAPGSTVVLILGYGILPEEMGLWPLTAVPNFLVPELLLLEMLALRQLWVLHASINSKLQKVKGQ